MILFISLCTVFHNEKNKKESFPGVELMGFLGEEKPRNALSAELQGAPANISD
jgi:hypothetical protein